MAIRLIFIIFTIFIMFISGNSYGAWQGPVEILSGIWGKGDGNFGIEHGDTSDRIPELTAVLFDRKIVISDQVNEREVVYSSDGILYKVVAWYMESSSKKTVNPDYPLYQYWNVQGYTSEGNIWININNYSLKSPTGQLLKTYTEKPLELGIIKEKKLPSGQYQVTVKYPDKEWVITAKGLERKYIKDINSNLYAVTSNNDVIKYDDSGNEIGNLKMPKIKYVASETPLPPDWPKNAEVPRPEVLEEYGSPVVAPNGDVYTWKRTPDKYYIIKWTWQN